MDERSARPDEVQPGPAGDFEEALVAYGKRSQDFQMYLAEVCDLSESLAAVMTAHRAAVAAAYRRGQEEMRERAASESDLVMTRAFPHHPAVQGAAEGIAARVRRLPLGEWKP